MNTPVEYTEHGARKLALLQRPQGKRWWWLIDEEGNDRRINRFVPELRSKVKFSDINCPFNGQTQMSESILSKSYES